MKISRLALSILFTTQFSLATNLVQAKAGDDLFSLCSKFPYNSKCKGYEAPIPLENRSGEKAQCLTSSQEKTEKCKVNITEESMTFYLETGDGLSTLEGAKDTTELIIPLTAVKSFSYSEKNKTNIGAVLAFGVWGLLSKKKTSTFNFRLETQEMQETQETQETPEETVIPQQAVFAVKRDVGRKTRRFLEETIGQPAELLDID